jgi:hypothetical protein
MPNFNIQTVIDDIVEQNNQYQTSKRDNAKFHISDAGGCYRSRIYKRMGVEPTRKIEMQGLRKMVAGDAGHEKLQQLLARGKKLFLSESEVETEHLLGHPDAVMKHGGEKYLVEFKTVEKWGMGWIKRDGAKREHVLQMFTYWVNLYHAVLSYVKREDFEAHDLYFVWGDIIQEEVNQEWTPLIDHWNNKTLPECTCADMYGGNGRKYCRYMVDEGHCCSESLFKV